MKHRLRASVRHRQARLLHVGGRSGRIIRTVDAKEVDGFGNADIVGMLKIE